MMFTGLRARLLLLLGLAVLPSVAFLIVGRNNERRATERELHAQALNLAKLTAQSWAQRIEIARQVLLSLARHPAMHGEAAECSALVRGLKGDYEDIYATLGRADLTGAVDCLQLDGGQPGLRITDRDYFVRARETGQFIVGEFMHGRIRRLPTLAFSYPLRDDRGEIRHIMFANVDLTVLSRELETTTRMDGTTVSLLDRNGALMARSADAERFFGIKKTTDAQLAMMRERGEMVSTLAGPDGVRYVVAVVAVRDRTNAIVAFATAGIPEKNSAGMMAAGIRSEWIMLGLLAVGLLLVAWGGSELLIRRPVAKLLMATAKLAEGDLAARIAPVGGARELEVLAAAFNRMARDLEERELHLREGQRLEAVGQLAGGIAHDFNNLLTVIIGYADVLQDRFQPAEKASKQIGALRSAAERASRLTQQLLAFSRRQVLSPATLQLNDVIRDMASLLRRTSGGDVTISLALDESLGYVHADPVQIEQVILNLVINARDAMPGGGHVLITTRNVHDGVPLVELSISDTGTGMDAATRARIFEPFFTTKGPRGTGLGLATAYGILKQSGGDIACESEVGVGTRFQVRLPRTSAPPVPPEAVRPVQVRGGSETILLVDDDHAVREVLEAVMAQRGYRVRATADANEALTWLSDGFAPDLVLTDVRMPGMNGAGFARALRAAAVALPIVFISGDAADVLSDEDPNGSRFLQKPIAAVELLREIRDVLDSRIS
jgi:signal transduction histidine kinase